MPPNPTNERILLNGRADVGRMPGHLLVSTCVYTAFAYFALEFAADAGASKYLLYGIIVLPLAAPAAAVFLQYSIVLVRRLAARWLVVRARRTFRTELRAARIHPELVNIDRLRAAALALSQVAPADALRASAEIAEAAEHRYNPIRTAGLSVIEATGVRPARSSGA